MTALPASTDFTGAAVTEAGFKTAITNQRDFLAGLLGTDGTTVSALAALQAPFCGVTAKTAAYTVAASDRGKVIYYTGSGGVNLTLPVTTTTNFGVGFVVSIKNASTGIITVIRSSSDTIDGASSIEIAANESAVLFISATAAWVAIGRSATANGQFQAMHVYTSSSTWSKPAGLKRVKVTVVGGGGNGGTLVAGDADGGAGGGGGGGTSIKVIEASALGSTESCVVGSVATTSSFGAHCSASGGSSASKHTPGAGGEGTGGDVNLTGLTGGIACTAIMVGTYITGNGGASSLGGPGPSKLFTVTSNGNAAAANSGSGGSGGGRLSSGTGTGGAGAAGLVIVEEFF